jgi:hypothetical protein
VFDFVQERRAVMEEFLRVTGPGGLISFSHRTDYVVPQGWGAIQQELSDEGAWLLLNETDGVYLPSSSAYHGVTLTHFLYRKGA